jgi:eukaryotic-like serine/threonine-protein kinase
MRARGDDSQAKELPKLSLAPYELLTALGSTAYGQSYRARHAEQGREVGLHLLDIEDDGEGTFASALPLAVAKCAQLSHPNVVALESHGRDGETGPTFLVTEPLSGVSLADQLEECGVIGLSRALALSLQIGRALRAAHKLGIVHGALSPENVRLVASEHGEIVRVVGFGSAMFVATRRDGRPALAPDSPYAAPECKDGGAPGPQSDVFAIGALLYRMLSGQPYAPRELPHRPSLSLLSRDPIPRDLEELVVHCLEPKLEARLSDVVTLMRRLREIVRVQNASASSLEERLTVSASSLPPPELPTAEGDSSGSLFAADATGRRGGLAWIAASLLLALAAVWLLWDASLRVRREPPPDRSVPVRSK